MTTPLRLAVGLALLSLVSVSPSHAAFVDLLGGKSLSTRDDSAPKKDSLKVAYKDPALTNLVNPTCSAANASSLQVITSNEVLPSVSLPCGNWRASGPGYTYKTTSGPGGIRSIRFRFGQLKVSIKDGAYSSNPVNGPITWLETRFTVGGTTYCGRWETPPSTFKKNQIDLIKAKGPSKPCVQTCGNGLPEGGEACDDGNHTNGDGCDNNCTLTACGNGIPTGAEDCDDGNVANGDGCRSGCTIEVCGDGIDDPQEDCDDGNNASGDCCNATCDFEANGSSCAADSNACTTEACNGAGSCVSTPNSNPCSDGNDCTSNDTCSGGTCVGDSVGAWINEFDYDGPGMLLTPNDDDDEFVEIAGPAGLNLSGYKLVSVEGAGPQCLTPATTAAGEAHFVATIPNGTILGNDTGTGVGFLVACFQNTSANVGADCDVVLPAPNTDSNLQNGDATNATTICPDGILLLDSNGDYVEAVSYEGIVANSGTYGPEFQVNPYNAGRENGGKAGVSIERQTSTLGAAAGAADWKLSDSCMNGGLLDSGCTENSSTPGTENPPQNLDCNIVYGSPYRAFLDPPTSLFE